MAISTTGKACATFHLLGCRRKEKDKPQHEYVNMLVRHGKFILGMFSVLEQSDFLIGRI